MIESNVGDIATDLRDFNESFALKPGVMASVCRVGEALAPRVGEMLDEFYRWMRTRPEYDLHFADPCTLARVRSLQQEYWKEFLSGNIDAVYIERRRAIGRIHALAGVRIATYMVALDWCGEWLARRVAALPWDAGARREATYAIARLVHVDAALALEAATQATLQQRNERLERPQKLQIEGRLAAGVAHDFNNLLTVISGYAGCVAREFEPGSRVHADMSEVLKASDRAQALISRLLAFSAGPPGPPQAIDPNRHIKDLKESLQPLVGEDVELLFRPCASIPDIVVDPGALQRIIANLVINGSDAMQAGGTLTIESGHAVLDDSFFRQRRLRGGKPGAYLSISVSDTGCGMDAKTLARVSDPCCAGEERGQGIGRGSSATRDLVAQMGGYIFADSKIGNGSFVCVYLPLEWPPALT